MLIDRADNQKGLAFVMHGLGGFKEQPQIKTIVEAFLENGYTTVRFDTTNAIGESDGKYEDATVTNYYEDLEDVIEWTRKQEWYNEPFVLAGHSIGGMCITVFSEKHKARVKAIAPLSVVISGTLFLATTKQEDLQEWERTGVWQRNSHSKPGALLKLNWRQFKDDLLKYNLMSEAHSLTMPVLIIVGEFDDSTPPEHQKILYDILPGKKEMHIIKGARHTFKEKRHLAELKVISCGWIQRIL
ncbi:MAG: alpha/beta hydrolase [Candidatus Woesearchaeota archaeon]